MGITTGKVHMESDWTWEQVQMLKLSLGAVWCWSLTMWSVKKVRKGKAAESERRKKEVNEIKKTENGMKEE